MLKRILAVGCSLSLALGVLAGCQTINGVKPDQVMQNLINVKSYEGKDSLQVKLTLSEAKLGSPDLSALKELSITMDSVKQDEDHSSMSGTLTYAGGSIPVRGSSVKDLWTLSVDGSKRPLVMELPSLTGAGAGGGASAAAGFSFASIDWMDLLKKHGSTLLNYMPNPSSLAVTDTKATINGSELALKKVHADLDGAQLGEMLQTLIKELLKDQQQFDILAKEVIKGIYGEDASPLLLSAGPGFVRAGLEDIAKDISKMGSFAEYMNKNNTLSLDLYVDSEAQVRRYEYNLKLAGLSLWDGLVTGLQANGTSDRWSINQKVKAQVVSGADPVVLAEPAGMARFITGLNKDSAAYKLFKNDLKMDRKLVQLPRVETGLPTKAVRPYIRDGVNVLMVPVRFVSESLDGDVKWNDKTKQVTVTDLWTGKTLVFTIGSDTVLVDGKAVKLQAAAKSKSPSAELTGGSTYVPARFIAESFGAKVDFNNATREVTITRDDRLK